MEKKKADIEELIATYSDHITGSFPDREQFRENLFRLLESKRERMAEGEYIVSLEKNVVFLSDLAVEGEAYIEVLLEQVNDDAAAAEPLESVLEEIEGRTRASASERHRLIFEGGGGEGFEGLIEAKGGDRKEYAKRLEFEYLFLMTFRIFLFEFINVLNAVRPGYHIERVDSAAPGLVLGNIRMTANLYLGNVTVGEIVEDDEKG